MEAKIKIPAHLYATARMKYVAISKCSSAFLVRKVCNVLKLNTSNYYRWKRTEESRKNKMSVELRLIHQVEQIISLYKMVKQMVSIIKIYCSGILKQRIKNKCGLVILRR